jgi:hypothetical protein
LLHHVRVAFRVVPNTDPAEPNAGFLLDSRLVKVDGVLIDGQEEFPIRIGE